MVVSILIALILLTSVVSHVSNYTKLMVIGDSVHRYMIEDWCRYYGGTMYNDGMNVPTNYSYPLTMKEIFKKHRRRAARSWEPRICENSRSNATVAFLFHKFGTKPHPPWHNPIAATAGLNRTILAQDLTLKEFFIWAQMPGIEAMNLAIGGPPHGVLLNSIFWDIAPRILEQTPLPHEEFVRQWSANISSLMRIVKKQTSSSIWHGWHTSAVFRVGERNNHPHWNTADHKAILLDMNNRSLEIARENGYDAIDFNKNKYFGVTRSRMRDALHPNSDILIKLLDDVVRRTALARDRALQ